MSMTWHKSDLAALTRISLSLHSILGFPYLFVIITKMEPIIFVYCFTIEGHNVFVTIEFFPHVSIMEEGFSQDPSNDGTRVW